MSYRLPLALLLVVAVTAISAVAADPAPPAPTATTTDASAAPLSADQLPQFDQAAIVRDQLARLNETREQVRVKAYAQESDHFVLFSDLDSRVRTAVLVWLEDLRSRLIAQLGIPEDARLWDGKCLAVVFRDQESLVDYALKFDNHRAGRSRGYFVLESRRRADPRLVHIVTFQPIEGGNDALREVLVHETTHAIIELYKRSATLPLWVHEGLAEYMTVQMDPTLRPAKQAGAYQRASTEPYQSIEPVLTQPFAASDLQGYSVSFSLIEMLMATNPHGLLPFIELLKDGVEPQDALGRAYPGFDYRELERRWRPWCMRAYVPAKP